MPNEQIFNGPIFIVGMPRSGTKLLRDLLNQHSNIAIPKNESHFIPYYYRNMYKFGQLQDKACFEKFYRSIHRTSFFQRLSAANKSVNPDIWYLSINNWTYTGIIEALYRCYAHQEGKRIWGDKTPQYLIHLPLLFSLFPQARVIHVIRDARDHCLSMRKAWGKNLFRSAQRWNDDISKCKNDVSQHKYNRYYEVKYEDLINVPQNTIRSICDFLDVDFQDNMLKLSSPSENIGDAKGKSMIVRKNYDKWKTELSKEECEKIEMICGSTLSELGYHTSYTESSYRINSFTLSIYKTLDFINILWFYTKMEKSLIRAIRSRIQARIISESRKINKNE